MLAVGHAVNYKIFLLYFQHFTHNFITTDGFNLTVNKIPKYDRYVCVSNVRLHAETKRKVALHTIRVVKIVGKHFLSLLQYLHE